MMTHWIQDLMNLYISCWHSLIFFHIWPLDVQAFSGFSLVGPSISVVLKMPTLHCYWSEPLGFMVLLSPLCHSASSQKSNLSVKQYKTLVVSSHHPRPKHFYHITTFLGLCIFSIMMTLVSSFLLTYVKFSTYKLKIQMIFACTYM